MQKEIRTLKETLKRKDGNLTFTTYRLVRAEELLNAYTVASDDIRKPTPLLKEQIDSSSSQHNTNNSSIAILTPSRESFLVHYRKLASVHTALLSSPFNGNRSDRNALNRTHDMRKIQMPYASSDSSVSSTDTLTHSIATTTSTTSKHDTKSNNSSSFHFPPATDNHSSSVRSSPLPQLSAPTPSSNAKQLLMGFLQGPPASIESITAPPYSSSSSGGSSIGSSTNNISREEAYHSHATVSKKGEEIIYPKKVTTPSRYAANTTPTSESDLSVSKDDGVSSSKRNARIKLKCYSLDAEECTDVDTSLQDLEEEEDDRDDDTIVVDELVLEKYQKSSSSSSSHPVAAAASSSSNNISCVTSSADGARSLERAYLQSNSSRSDPMKSLIKSFLLSNPSSSSSSSSTTIIPTRQQQQHPTFNVYSSSSSSAAPPQSQSNVTFHHHPIVPSQPAVAPRASSSIRSRSQPSIFDKLLANSRDSNSIAISSQRRGGANPDMTSSSFAETTTTTATAVHSNMNTNMNRENIMWSSFPVRTTNASASAISLNVPIADDVSIATAPNFNFNFSSNNVVQHHHQREVNAATYSDKQPENFSSMSPNSFQGAILRMRAENNRIRTDIQRFKGTVEVYLNSFVSCLRIHLYIFLCVFSIEIT